MSHPLSSDERPSNGGAYANASRTANARALSREVIDHLREPALEEQSLIACPIESYGERVGAILVSQSDPRRNFDAEDLEFVESVADRLGAAVHIHRLTRVAHEGHRAAEELAIVDAHGGTIGVESEEGRGSKFTFRLPLGRE